jgi:cytoskeletal protein RodZ
MATSPLEGWRVADIRETKGISLEQIADLTKLRVSTLKAIEDGDFDALPGGIYNISYIRQYARAIDADESRLIQLYRLQHQIAS